MLTKDSQPATVWTSERRGRLTIAYMYMDRPRPSDTNLGESRLYQKEIAAVTNTALYLAS